MTKLTGKVAYVTGAGRGIGRAIALKLAGEGARLVLNDLDAEPVEAVRAEILALGGEAIAVPGSVTAEGFAQSFIDHGIAAFDGIDIIVNNAGYTWDSLIGKMSDAQFDAILDVHLKAPFQILRAAAEPIRIRAAQEAAEGREVFRKVVNISSIAGTGGNMGQANYASAKAGIIGLTKTLSKEWGRFKVNVNCVAFGLIETRMTAASETKASITVEGNQVAIGLPPKVLDGFRSLIPLGRAGTPEEAADGVYLFCAPESNYVSGQVLVVGGGISF